MLDLHAAIATPERKVKVLLPEGNAPGGTASPEEVKKVTSKRQHTRCPTCHYWFQSDSTYRVHLFSHQESNRDLTVTDAMSQAGRNVDLLSPELEMRFQCPECEHQFETWLKLVDHVAVHGSATKQRRSAESRAAATTDDYLSSAIKETKLKCDLCYKSFSSTERLMVSYSANSIMRSFVGIKGVEMKSFKSCVAFATLVNPSPLQGIRK